MAKAATSKAPPSNVVRLITSNERKKDERQQRPMPWHVEMAISALEWRSLNRAVFHALTLWEAEFLASMTIWDRKPTERQVAALERILNKVDRALNEPTTPPPAA
jgi:hypothetical protein